MFCTVENIEPFFGNLCLKSCKQSRKGLSENNIYCKKFEGNNNVFSSLY